MVHIMKDPTTNNQIEEAVEREKPSFWQRTVGVSYINAGKIVAAIRTERRNALTKEHTRIIREMRCLHRSTAIGSGDLYIQHGYNKALEDVQKIVEASSEAEDGCCAKCRGSNAGIKVCLGPACKCHVAPTLTEEGSKGCDHDVQTAKWVCDECGQTFDDMKSAAVEALREGTKECVCGGRGWVHIEGATEYPLTRDCVCLSANRKEV